MSDKIDLSLDEIIKLQKKQKQQQRRTTATTTVSKVKQFRGKVGTRRLQGVSPLNRATGVKRQQRGALTQRGRGQGRGRGQYRSQAQGYPGQGQRGRGQGQRGRGQGQRGRGQGQRGRGQGQRGLGQGRVQQVGVKQQRVRNMVTPTKVVLTQRQQSQKQRRQSQQNQRRGINVIQQQQQQQGGQRRLSRRFSTGAMQSDLIIQQETRTKRKWGRTNTQQSTPESVITVSLPNESSKDVSVQIPRVQHQQLQQQQQQRGRGGRGRGGRGRGGRQQAGQQSTLVLQQTLQPGGVGKGPGRGRGRGRGRGQGGRGQGGRGQRGNTISLKQAAPSVKEAIANLKPAKKQNYSYKLQDFGKAHTTMTMNERFASLQPKRGGARNTPDAGNSSGRQVFM